METVTTRIALVGLLPKDGSMLELGTAQGAFAEQIAKARPDLNLFCVDAWAGDGSMGPPHDQAEMEKTIKRLEPYDNVGVFRHSFHDFVSYVPEGHFDCVYCDLYAHTGMNGSAMEIYWPKIKQGGVLAVHDYCKEWPANMAAVDSFFAAHDITEFRVTTQDRYATVWTLKP